MQIDGCEHYWFEDRAPPCTALVYIDDATSRLMHILFTGTESTFGYFEATRQYLERHGKPLAFYSDKASIFRINQVSATRGDGHTQFGRALYELNIDGICANTPAAKGRVERAHLTMQDRLVKEFRLEGPRTISWVQSIKVLSLKTNGSVMPYGFRTWFKPSATIDRLQDHPLLIGSTAKRYLARNLQARRRSVS